MNLLVVWPSHAKLLFRCASECGKIPTAREIIQITSVLLNCKLTEDHLYNEAMLQRAKNSTMNVLYQTAARFYAITFDSDYNPIVKCLTCGNLKCKCNIYKIDLNYIPLGFKCQICGKQNCECLIETSNPTIDPTLYPEAPEVVSEKDNTTDSGTSDDIVVCLENSTPIEVESKPPLSELSTSGDGVVKTGKSWPAGRKIKKKKKKRTLKKKIKEKRTPEKPTVHESPSITMLYGVCVFLCIVIVAQENFKVA